MLTTVAAQDKTEQCLAAGSQLMRDGDVYAATRAFQEAIHLDRSLRPAYPAQARAYLEGGYVDEAIEYFQTAARMGGLEPEDELLLDRAIRSRDERMRQLRAARTVLGLPVVRFLGVGWEGASYVASEPDGTYVVVKAFHPAFVQFINYEGLGGLYRKPVPSARQDLERLAAGLEPGGHALYRFDLIRDGDTIVGLKYHYQFLLPINRRTIRCQSLRLAVVGAFLRTQAYLLKTFQLCLSDAGATRQFMITLKGRPRYLDYGTTLIPIGDFRCQEDHWEVVAAIELLFSVFEPEKERMLSGAGLKRAIQYATAMGDGARRHGFMWEILQHLQRGKLDAFLDPDFYLHLSRGLPITAGPLPRLLGGGSVLRRRLLGESAKRS